MLEQHGLGKFYSGKISLWYFLDEWNTCVRDCKGPPEAGSGAERRNEGESRNPERPDPDAVMEKKRGDFREAKITLFYGGLWRFFFAASFLMGLTAAGARPENYFTFYDRERRP